jgi:glyoxylase-like metal-dependent hydrolase (beta-lactamase superfamily II)
MPLSRRQFLVASSVVLAEGFGQRRSDGGQQTPAAQPPPAPVTVFTPLRGNVGTFTGQGGTIGWMVSPDGVAVVDSQMGAAAGACLAGVKERASNRMIDVLFNTHHHGDHTGGNGVFRPAVKKIVAHVNVPALQKKAARPGTEDTQVYADTTFTDNWSISLGKEKITAAHYGPGHTGGDSVITFAQANVAHVGDLVFQHRLPVTDRPGGCQIANWATVLERVAKDHPADTIYIFGHSKQGMAVTGDKADLLYQRDFLTALLDFVRGEIKAGKTRDQIVKAAPELKPFPDHGPLSERVLTAAYEELAEG